jgi:hypothetical protein
LIAVLSGVVVHKIDSNIDARTTEGFGLEWSTFTQNSSDLAADERQQLFDQYFHLFPWSDLPRDAEGLDAGCGTGRWATLVAPRVGRLHLLDASDEALAVQNETSPMPAMSRFILPVSAISRCPIKVSTLPIPSACCIMSPTRSARSVTSHQS